MADYPITNVSRRVVYTGSAGVGPYAFSFPVLTSTDIAVYKNSTLLTLTTDYTVSINSSTGEGSVTLVSAATGSDRITIVGARAIQRSTDFVTGGDFFANTLNTELDSEVIFVQQVAETAERSIKAPVTDPTSINMTLPSNTTRASKFLSFDSSGNPQALDSLGSYKGNWASGTSYILQDIVKDTSNNNIYICINAHTSTGSQPISSNADVAKWSLVVDSASASTSATNAASSASAAATSATNAASSASNASTSASTATTKASEASTSATNAASSESSAASSASSASTSASTATTKASEASTSATNAASSASSASTSASNASTSASSASTSASAASSSASSASTSASNASTSASNAATSATNAANSATSASSAQAAAESARDATLAAYDSFDDRYLGAKSSAPSVDNDGNALIAGALYFDTVAQSMQLYTGSIWTAAYISGSGYLAAANNLSELTNKVTARSNLGLVIGTDVQAYDAELAAIAGLTSAADKGIQFTGAGTAATYTLTTAGKALLDDADAAAQRTTLGVTATGSDTTYNYRANNLSDVANASTARTNLGLAIGTNVQAWDADLDAIAAISATSGFLKKTAANTWSLANAGLTTASVQTTGFTAAANTIYPCNTTSAAFTVTLPASPTAGDQIGIIDYAGTFATNNLTLNPNGGKIKGDTSNSIASTANEAFILIYIDATKGWLYLNDTLANPAKPPYTASYLVIAGGGGGGFDGSGPSSGNGGGAGGYVSGTMTINGGTVYSVSVGAGGAKAPGTTLPGSNGSPSTLTGATSAVGGGYGVGSANNVSAGNGGSGGGGSTSYPGGSGTPGQGNAGAGLASNTGGGGASTAGSGGASATTGIGGNGTSSSITGSPVAYAGGGCSQGVTTAPTGGTAGGQNGASNTGAGGGGQPFPAGGGGNGGSGIVILSVPTVSYSGSVTGSPTITTSGSNTIIKFTSGSGSYTG